MFFDHNSICLEWLMTLKSQFVDDWLGCEC